MSTSMQKAKAGLSSFVMDGPAGGDNKAAADLIDRAFAKTCDFIKAADDGMAGTATSETVFGMAEGPGKPIAAYIVPTGSTGLTADSTDFATIIVRAYNAAFGSGKIIASKTTKLVAAGGSGDWTQGVKVPLVLGSVDLALVDGAALSVEITKGGMGVVVPACRLYVVVSPE